MAGFPVRGWRGGGDFCTPGDGGGAAGARRPGTGRGPLKTFGHLAMAPGVRRPGTGRGPLKTFGHLAMVPGVRRDVLMCFETF